MSSLTVLYNVKFDIVQHHIRFRTTSNLTLYAVKLDVVWTLVNFDIAQALAQSQPGLSPLSCSYVVETSYDMNFEVVTAQAQTQAGLLHSQLQAACATSNSRWSNFGADPWP